MPSIDLNLMKIVYAEFVDFFNRLSSRNFKCKVRTYEFFCPVDFANLLQLNEYAISVPPSPPDFHVWYKFSK